MISINASSYPLSLAILFTSYYVPITARYCNVDVTTNLTLTKHDIAVIVYCINTFRFFHVMILFILFSERHGHS